MRDLPSNWSSPLLCAQRRRQQNSSKQVESAHTSEWETGFAQSPRRRRRRPTPLPQPWLPSASRQGLQTRSDMAKQAKQGKLLTKKQTNRIPQMGTQKRQQKHKVRIFTNALLFPVIATEKACCLVRRELAYLELDSVFVLLFLQQPGSLGEIVHDSPHEHLGVQLKKAPHREGANATSRTSHHLFPKTERAAHT